jgi:hypothetical protein
MLDADIMRELTDLKNHVVAVEARASHAEKRADDAASVALGAVETIKHFQKAAEHGHAQTGEILAATRKMVGVVETLAAAVLSK